MQCCERTCCFRSLPYVLMVQKVNFLFFRNSRPEEFCRKAVLRNFTKFIRKHLGLQLYLKRLWHRCLPLNFAKFLRTLFLQNTSGGCFCMLIRIYLLILRLQLFRFQTIQIPYRSSRPDMFCEKGVLRNFVKFRGKHLCQGLFFNKVPGLRTATLLKTRPWHRYFLINSVEFLRTPFCQNTSG